MSCDVTTLDAVCAKLAMKFSIPVVKQVTSTSNNVTPANVWVANHLDPNNKTVLDIINAAVELFGL